MKVYVVTSEWGGPQAAFRTEEAARAYTKKVSGGSLMTVRELELKD